MAKSNYLCYESDDVSLIPNFEKKGYRTSIILYVNGKKIPEDLCRKARPDQTLLDFIRKVLKLTGSKLGCGEGGCGACTVMISKYDVASGKKQHFAVNACLMPVCAADMCHITTVEGIGSTQTRLHPIQARIAHMHGSQCGYCTPGIVVALYALFASGRDNICDVEEHMDGNLCRCTGYRPIWDAAKSLCTDSPRGPCGTPCSICPSREICEMPCNKDARDGPKETTGVNTTSHTAKAWGAVVTSSTSKYNELPRLNEISCANDGTAFIDQPDAMFPSELTKRSIENPQESLIVVGDRTTWFKPATLSELLQLLKTFPGSKIIVGATEIGIETKFKNAIYPRLIYPSCIPELTCFTYTKESLIIGSCTPLSVIQHECEKLTKLDSPAGNRTVAAIFQMLRWFASVQIRNVACLGGNLVTASPISDMNPLLSALGATLTICSASRPTRTVLTSDFFVAYRKVALSADEVITTITIPLTRPVFDYLMPFKQAKRREDDISIATSGIRLKVTPSEDCRHFIITDAALAFGGMAAKTVMAIKTAKVLIGKPWSSETFSVARKQLVQELGLSNDAPGGQIEYRRSLAASFLFKFFLSSTLEISKDIERVSNGLIPGVRILGALPQPLLLTESELSGTSYFLSLDKPKVEGTQIFPSPKITAGIEDSAPDRFPLLPASNKASEKDALGIAVHHASSELHCTGEAIYVDDIPEPQGMLHSALILSNRCNCRIATVDKTKALLIPNVVGVYLYADLLAIGGENKLGPIVKDEEVFATDEIRHVGVVIGIVVAETLDAASAAARAVEVTYIELGGSDGSATSPIISIEDAIEANSFFQSTSRKLEFGNIEKDLFEAMDDTKYVTVSGEFRVGGQEHFYLECNASLVIPDESGLKIYSSTQAPTKTQMVCASATNLPASKVVCHVKRMGGGFGGKETRSVFAAAAAAVAAKISRRPVKISLERNVDMAITGQRHAFLAKYRASASFDPNLSPLPKLHAFDVEIFSNGGCSLDLSLPVLDRALFHIDNVYQWKSLRARGVVCRTAQPPHTAFRGFGGPQGLAICEHVVDHLVSALPKSHQNFDAIRRANLYKEGSHTPFGMQIVNWNVPNAWDSLCSAADVLSRRSLLAKFNARSRWKKRGMAVIPTKFGIAFTSKFMNQGGSLVHLYQDGTILVTHGGTEMGQGLHTKIAQVAAHAFSVQLSSVFVNETSTDKVANTIPTAASMSTDLYGMATLNACREILDRIKPIRDRLGPEATLAQIATAAFFERIDLSAHGFYKLDNNRCGYDWEAPETSEDTLKSFPENSHRGQPFNYFTQGVAATEVEIDILTGDHRTIRTDIIVDVGSSLNPAIDIGQIEGAFVQGMGWSTIEELIWGDKDHLWVQPPGKLFTQGPGTYKIPAFNDTPEIFNVTLMDTSNPFAIHSSRAVGEPPFFLGASVFFAIKDAIRAARLQELGEAAGQFVLNLPSTSERIRMSCGDPISCECVLPTTEEEAFAKEAILGFQTKGSF